jgi:hypothetical protein
VAKEDNEYKAIVVYNPSSSLLKVALIEIHKIETKKSETKTIYTYFNNFPEKKEKDKKDWWIFDTMSLDSNKLEFNINNHLMINTEEKKEKICKQAIFQSIFLDEARERLLRSN